jgi:hypothetical protein
MGYYAIRQGIYSLPEVWQIQRMMMRGGIYIERALKLIEKEMREAALRMDDALFVEY